jgi:hypothetical protein
MNLRRLLCIVLLALPVALGLTQPALATGGNYVIVGGTGYEQQQVKAALAASSFNWSVVPGVVTINIAPGSTSEAVPGAIFLEPSLLDSGEFSWGVVQHEYAHEVDFALLDASAHARLNTLLGGASWCYEDNPALAHNQYGCERFASTLAWSFWQSPANCMRPSAVSGESGGMAPAAFRTLIPSMLGAGAQAAPAPASVTPRLAPRTTRTPKQSKH